MIKGICGTERRKSCNSNDDHNEETFTLKDQNNDLGARKNLQMPNKQMERQIQRGRTIKTNKMN